MRVKVFAVVAVMLSWMLVVKLAAKHEDQPDGAAEPLALKQPEAPTPVNETKPATDVPGAAAPTPAP